MDGHRLCTLTRRTRRAHCRQYGHDGRQQAGEGAWVLDRYGVAKADVEESRERAGKEARGEEDDPGAREAHEDKTHETSDGRGSKASCR